MSENPSLSKPLDWTYDESSAYPGVSNNDGKRHIHSNSHLHDDTAPAPKHLRRSDGLSVKVATHYNNIEEKGLSLRNTSSIICMRNFNNWIKTILIQKSLKKVQKSKLYKEKIVVLDLGCGKGGDINKWRKAGVDHYIGADIANTSVVQCQERYKKMHYPRDKCFSAEFIVADCTKVKLRPNFKDPTIKVDIVSCQFAFHYCFESLSQAETMVSNISEALEPGGVFIGTTPNDNHIVSLTKSRPDQSYESGIMKIQFPKGRSDPPPLFGDTYHFFLEGVVDCPEFVVHFPTVVRLFEKYGMTLIYDRTFGDMWIDSTNDRQLQNLLSFMRGLEKIDVEGASEDYDHAKAWGRERGLREVQTLSKKEWDAVSIYRGFAFVKGTDTSRRPTDTT